MVKSHRTSFDSVPVVSSGSSRAHFICFNCTSRSTCCTQLYFKEFTFFQMDRLDEWVPNSSGIYKSVYLICNSI